MAAAGAPFSIRDYAARERVRAGGGSCPFGGAAGALPPMEVRMFRWWADEAAAVEEEEAEVERRMAAKRRKRSVAELCAAVPRVAGRQVGKGARRRVDAKEKGKLPLGVRVQTSKGFDKKKAAIGIGVRKKEKNRKVKVTSVSISHFFQDSKRKRDLGKSFSNQKRNQKVSVLLDKISNKGNKNSILDNQKKAITKQLETGLDTSVDKTDVRGKSKSSCKQKNVTFSVDIFGCTGSLPEDSTEQSQLVQASQRPPHGGDDHCNTDEPKLIYQGADAISGTVEENTSSISEKVASVSTGVCRRIPLTRPNGRIIPDNSVHLNHRTEICSSSNRLNSISLAHSYSQVPSQNFDILDTHLNKGLNLDAAPRSSIPVSLAVKARSGDLNCRNPTPQTSDSCLVASLKVNDRGKSILCERLVSNRHLAEVYPVPRKYVMSSISSSTGPNKSADVQAMDCVSACRNICFCNDYAGLPLNSHGEFVNVPAGGTPNPIENFKRQCLGEKSSCPSDFRTLSTPQTCMDHTNLKLNHHVPQIYTGDKSVFHPDPSFIPVMPTAFGMDFGQLPNSERIHNHSIPCNKYLCLKQRELSMECFCSRCIGHDSPPQKLLGMQSCFLGQNYEQNTLPIAEATVRLMGKTVSLGNSYTEYESPCSSKQIRRDNHSIQRTCTEASPMLFHGALVDPPAYRIPIGGRQPCKNQYFSFVPAAEQSGLDTGSLRTNGQNQQLQLTAANNLYVQPVRSYIEFELGQQQPAVAHQVRSNAEDMSLGFMHGRHTQNIATVSSFDRRNNFINFIETSPAPYQSTYPMQEFSSMTHRTSVSSCRSGYAVQSTPDSTTQTKFTSLPPLPPSVISSHVYNADYAQPPESAPFYPPNPLGYPTNSSNAPSDAIFRYENMKWTAIGSKLEGLEHMKTSCKRPADKDDMSLTLSKKPCIAVQKDLNFLPISEKGLEFWGYRPDAQPQGMPVGIGSEPEADLRLGRNEAQTSWSVPLNTVTPVQLKAGARHVLQPSASSMGLENSRPTLSITPFAVE
ncbi:hypothetical protein ACP70R_039615 [Stipagrostis hirtigluma subsp. patula]